MSASASCVLEARKLSAGYFGHPVVHDLDLAVNVGEIVALLGANGAGKSTTLLALAGALKPLGGGVLVDGKETRGAMYRRMRQGIAFVMDDRSLFAELSARENLKVGLRRDQLPAALELFPELKPLLDRRAGLLSGGEQQMLTLGRALARAPRLLLADELSLGLGPLVVKRLLTALREVADSAGVGVLLVEQHTRQALNIADRAYVMRRGRIVSHGSADEVAEHVGDIYLGGDVR